MYKHLENSQATNNTNIINTQPILRQLEHMIRIFNSIFQAHIDFSPKELIEITNENLDFLDKNSWITIINDKGSFEIQFFHINDEEKSFFIIVENEEIIIKNTKDEIKNICPFSKAIYRDFKRLFQNREKMQFFVFF
jgi:hypothetical protein